MYEPPPAAPADISPFAPEHPDSPAMPTPAPQPAPQPEPAPIQEHAAAMSWAPIETPAAPPETAGPSTTNPPPTSDWPAPGKPETPAPAPAREPGGGAGSPTWTPVQTGSWTPGPAHASSSEWTGEATPIPGPVPKELRDAISSPSYTAPATYSPPAPAPVTAPPIPRAPAPAPAKKPAPKKKRDDDGGMPSGRPRLRAEQDRQLVDRCREPLAIGQTVDQGEPDTDQRAEGRPGLRTRSGGAGHQRHDRPRQLQLHADRRQLQAGGRHQVLVGAARQRVFHHQVLRPMRRHHAGPARRRVHAARVQRSHPRQDRDAACGAKGRGRRRGDAIALGGGVRSDHARRQLLLTR